MLAGPVITEMAKARATTTARRPRNLGATAPSTGAGWSRATSATVNRSGSVTHRAMTGTRARGTTARATVPRKPRTPEASEWMMAVHPAPTP